MLMMLLSFVPQGNLVKQSMGLSKRVHTTELLESLNIPRPESIVHRNILSLYMYNRISHVKTPLLDLTSHFLSEYLLHNTIIPGTRVYPRYPVLLTNISQYLVMYPMVIHVLTLSVLSFSENFIKPYSDEHFLVHLLTKSF